MFCSRPERAGSVAQILNWIKGLTANRRDGEWFSFPLSARPMINAGGRVGDALVLFKVGISEIMRKKLAIAFVSVALVAGLSNYFIVAIFSDSAVSTAVGLAIADALIGILAGISLSRYFTRHLKDLATATSQMS